MTIFGYARQNYPIETSIQIEKLVSLNCDDLFVENEDLKTDNQLMELLDQLHQGDKVYVVSLLVFGKMLNDLQEVVDKIISRGGRLVSLDEDFDTDKSYSVQKTFQLITSVNTKIVSDKTRQGLDEVKKTGKQLGRPGIEQETIDLMITLREQKKLSLRKISEITGASLGTVAKYIKQSDVS